MTYYVMQDTDGNAWGQAVEPGLIVFPGAGVTVVYQGTNESVYQSHCRDLGIPPAESPAGSVYE
jgi:hypothetical protein